jgi:hypothetical protein
VVKRRAHAAVARAGRDVVLPESAGEERQMTDASGDGSAAR